ncbi:hypothetical protein C2G38_2130023 [Gigaspora rosea]|uniref:Uncharacterized protein n=1 Tax=Gigaspora rosea TaxID=44941 RepID=A0A397TZ02_9GLOM|nr:hypothetical protein C2G38_2130023 [Gigaspora rosea]
MIFYVIYVLIFHFHVQKRIFLYLQTLSILLHAFHLWVRQRPIPKVLFHFFH